MAFKWSSAVANLKNATGWGQLVVMNDILLTAGRYGGAPAALLVWFLSAVGAESVFPLKDDEGFYPAAQILDINVLCPQKHCTTEQYCTCPGPVFLFYAGWISMDTDVGLTFTKYNDFPLFQSGYHWAYKQNVSVVAYLNKCLHPMRTFDQFDRHSGSVIHPRALCDCSKGATPQKGFHLIEAGFRNKEVSWTYLVFISRIVRHCRIHHLVHLARLDVDRTVSDHIACSL